MKEMRIQQLEEIVEKFCSERDWDQFHDPKSLACLIITEAGELLEPFRFCSAQESEELLNDPIQRRAVAEELSDVLFGLLRISQKYQLNLTEAFMEKMKVNERKYPISQFKGSNRKYNQD
tara:strand:+ start:45627 stop:45986 length:360 start_codon:yes stop_codon:yes gene_type:complete